MKNGNIYISDLDGTLLNKNARLSKFSEKSINRIIQSKIPFTIATARSIKSIQPIFSNVELLLPVIEFNGAFISDLRSGKHLIINNIDDEMIVNITEKLKEYDLNFFVSSFNGDEDKLYFKDITNDGETWYINDRIINNDPRLTRVNTFESSLQENIVCITIINHKNKLMRVFNDFKNVLNVELHLQENIYSPGWFWLTIHSALATKDKSIKILIEKYKFSDKCVTVFGDNTNDLKMFSAANRAIAVSNAAKEVKVKADQIIGSNEDDSVVKFIMNENNISYELSGYEN